jgi:threonine aldolase
MYEQGGSASLAGVASRAVRNEPDGTMLLDSIVAAMRADNVHFPVTQLVCLEQTHNMCG